MAIPARDAEPVATRLASWACGVTADDLPHDVAMATRRRVLDVIGLALAGSRTPFGRSTRAGALAMSAPGPCHLFGTGDATALGTAAFVNGALSQALEFDDTHDESIVHMSSPSVAASLAIAETRRVSGRELLAAIAVANEIACRAGCVAPGQFHKRGLHPTGLFAPFGVTFGAGRLLALAPDVLASAAGICGSFAAGLLECWVDGTQAKFLHSGWAAQSGIAAALLARAGTTGPARVFEGRFGLFASHLQDPAIETDYARLADDLGDRWESRRASFKPYPAAHVIHPYVDAALRLRFERHVRPEDIERVDCAVAGFVVGIVCEPAAEKVAPVSDAHCRVSLQHTMAEALYFGDLGRTAYSDARRLHPAVQALARRVHYHVDPDYPGPGQFRGAIRVTLTDGRTLTAVQEHNRGSAANPMSDAELRAKFDDNASECLSPAARDRLADTIARLDELDDASTVVRLALGDLE